MCSLRLSSRLLSIGVYTAYLIKLNKVFSWKRTKISCFIGTVLHIISQTNSAKLSDLSNLFAICLFLSGLGMKKELQTLRDEIKMLAGQIQKKLKSEY